MSVQRDTDAPTITTGTGQGGRTLGRVLIFLALALIAFTTVYPLLFLTLNAFKEKMEYYTNQYGPPATLYLGNFTILRENFNIVQALLNSAFVTVIAVTAALFVSSIASFALAKIDFAGQSLVFRLVIGLLLVPGQVLLIPIYLMFSNLNLVNTFLAVILIYGALALPFATFFLTSSFRSIPNELIESARIDGATLGRVYWSIVLPLGRPALLTLAVLSGLTMWNELLLGMMLLPDESKRLLTPALALLTGRLLTNQPLLMAGLLISSVPAVLTLIIFSRYLVRGITVGAVR